MPIRDPVEMGFSGENGDPDYDVLLDRMRNTDYYPVLFAAAFGTEDITEDRMQRALAQFIRSMQSLDAKYDVGRAQVNNDRADFPNFTAAENRGKALFLTPPQFNAAGSRIGGGLGCGGCHQAPEFSITVNSGHNGVTGSISGERDATVTRAPSLRDVFLPDGRVNGPFMHTGEFTTLEAVLNHYDEIPGGVTGLDQRLRPRGQPQRLNLTDQERAEVVAFFRTLTGNQLFTDTRWSDPFLEH